VCVSWKCRYNITLKQKPVFLCVYYNRINLRYLVICKNVRQRPRKTSKTVDGNGALIDASCVSQAGISKVFKYYFLSYAYSILAPIKYVQKNTGFRICTVCRCNSAYRCNISKNMGASILIYI